MNIKKRIRRLERVLRNHSLYLEQFLSVCRNQGKENDDLFIYIDGLKAVMRNTGICPFCKHGEGK